MTPVPSMAKAVAPASNHGDPAPAPGHPSAPGAAASSAPTSIDRRFLAVVPIAGLAGAGIALGIAALAEPLDVRSAAIGTLASAFGVLAMPAVALAAGRRSLIVQAAVATGGSLLALLATLGTVLAIWLTLRPDRISLLIGVVAPTAGAFIVFKIAMLTALRPSISASAAHLGAPPGDAPTAADPGATGAALPNDRRRGDHPATLPPESH